MSEENKQASVGDWDNDFPSDEENKSNENQSNNRIPFMKFDKPKDYTVRLVGNHVKFYRHWQPFTDRVITHPDYKSEDPAWQAKFYPRETFAIHVIDREDGQLKILEKGRSLFKQFARYKLVNEVNPAGKDGPDWVITVEWPNGNKRQAKYNATPKAKPAPWTEEEIKMIKAKKAPLKDIYATTPLEKIQELWNNLPDEAKIPPKKDKEEDDKPKDETPTKKVVDETPPDIDDEDDDLFGDDGDDDTF